MSDLESPDASNEELAGARSYTPLTLRVYNLWVLRFNNRFVWRCPSRYVRELYDRNVSGEHLDIGPGTGWFLCHARYPVEHPSVTLVDLNEHTLALSGKRLRRKATVTSRVGGILRPLPVERRYPSVAASLVMHCVPGNWDTKGRAFSHVADVTTDDGVFFGATVLNVGVPQTKLSRRVSAVFNQHGIFHNESDDLAGLRAALGQSFADVEVNVVGATALWTARKPRRTGQ